MFVQQLDIQRFGRFVIAIVDPIGRMLDQRPEIIVEVQHQEPQPLLLDRSVSFTVVVVLPEELGPADPHHADLVARVQPRDDFGGGFVERLLVNRQRLVDDRFDFPAPHDLIQAGDSVAAARCDSMRGLCHRRAGETVADEIVPCVIAPSRSQCRPQR